MKFQLPHAGLIVAVLAGAGGLCAAESWDSLLQNSPFGAAAPTAAAPAGAPEFCSYFSEGGETFFSVYDPARKRASWLRQDETAGGLTARRFEAGPQVLHVEFEGRALALPLKRAALRTSPVSPAPGAPAVAAAPAALSEAEAATPEIKRAELNLARARQRLEFENRRKLAAERARQAQAAGGTR